MMNKDTWDRADVATMRDRLASLYEGSVAEAVAVAVRERPENQSDFRRAMSPGDAVLVVGPPSAEDTESGRRFAASVVEFGEFASFFDDMVDARATRSAFGDAPPGSLRAMALVCEAGKLVFVPVVGPVVTAETTP